jgi:hypothetical protein
MIFPFGEAEKPDKRWKVETEPQDGVLYPGNEKGIVIKVQPPADGQPGDCATHSLGVFAPIGDVFTTIDGLAFRTCMVNPSQLTCSVPEQPVPLRLPVSVNGALIPNLGGTPLALEYISPSGWPMLRNLNTKSDGSYGDEFTPTLVGDWTVQAFWQGNAEYAQAQSSLCRFVVAESTGAPTFTPSQLTNCRAGPGTGYDLVAVAAADAPLPVEGRDLENGWFYVRLPGDIMCWVGGAMGKTQGDFSGVVVLAAPPPPEPKEEPFNCGQFLTLETCNAHAQCKWDSGGGGQCKNK